MSYINFDKYPSWLSCYDLNKNRGRMADELVSSLLAIITFTIKPCSFFSILFCIFLIIIIWSRKIGVISKRSIIQQSKQQFLSFSFKGLC